MYASEIDGAPAVDKEPHIRVGVEGDSLPAPVEEAEMYLAGKVVTTARQIEAGARVEVAIHVAPVINVKEERVLPRCVEPLVKVRLMRQTVCAIARVAPVEAWVAVCGVQLRLDDTARRPIVVCAATIGGGEAAKVGVAIVKETILE